MLVCGRFGDAGEVAGVWGVASLRVTQATLPTAPQVGTAMILIPNTLQLLKSKKLREVRELEVSEIEKRLLSYQPLVAAGAGGV